MKATIARTAWMLLIMASLFPYAAAAGSRASTEALVRGNTDFAIRLYRREQAGSGNFFFSPYSISSALAMTWTGARGNTQAEMSRTLGLGSNAEEVSAAFRQLNDRLAAVAGAGKVSLSVANSLWCERTYPFSEAFLNLNRKFYQAEARQVDFLGAAEPVREEINSWVAKHTQDKIQNILQPGQITRQTTLVLCNAIYFKGNWTTQFDPRHTGPAPFHAPSGEIQAMLMRQLLTVRSAAIPEGVLFALPYADGSLSMVILLPDAADGINALEKNLTGSALQQWLADLDKAAPTKASVLLPRFKLETRLDLAQTLAEMGMPSAFGSRADFSGISPRRDLSISDVTHQAFVEVNETGTEAAAATAVTMKRTSVEIPAKELKVDHPFVFLIRENQTGNILFLGRILSPK